MSKNLNNLYNNLPRTEIQSGGGPLNVECSYHEHNSRIVETINDINNIKQILDDFTPHLYSLSSGKVSKTYLAEKFSKSAVVVAIKIDNKMVGFAAFYCNDIETKKAFLSLIAVEPNYRKQGVGKMLLTSVESYSKNSGMENIYLDVRKENQTAIHFYSLLGFKCVNENANVYTMSKLLK